MTPQVAGVIQEMFQGAERGRAFGLLGATIGLSTAVGPLAGGALLGAFGEQHGWRWVLFVNIPVGLATLPLAYRLLPPPHPRTRRESLDPVGVVLLGAGVITVLLPLVEDRQWRSAAKWWLLLVAAALLAAFVLWERWYRKRSDPLIRLELFRLRSYSLGFVLILLYFCGFVAIFFVLALFLQVGLGYSRLLSGVAMTPFALGSSAAAGLGGCVVSRYGRPLVVAGLVMAAIGLAGTDLAIYEVPGRSVGWAMLVPLLVAGIGSGLVIAPNQTITLSEVPVAQAGTAAGLVQTAHRIGSAVGIAAVGAVLFTQLGATGRYAHAIERALLVSIAFVVAALALGIADVLGAGRPTPAPAPARA